MHIKRLAILSLALTTALCAHAQWRSVHAAKTTVKTITKPDGQVSTTTTTSDYYRSTSGSELTLTTMSTPSGMFVKKYAELYDADSPAQYDIDYQTKTAYLIVRMQAPRPFMTDRTATYPGLKHSAYQGLDCVLIPVMMNGKRIGTYWVDDKDDLIVKKDVALTYQHTVMTLSNITFGAKYNPSLFHVPAGFTVDTSRSKSVPATE